jgi:hypothetical protein
VNSIKSGRDAGGRRAYNMSPSVRSKKIAGLVPFRRKRSGWTSKLKNGPHRSDGKP